MRKDDMTKERGGGDERRSIREIYFHRYGPICLGILPNDYAVFDSSSHRAVHQ